ncbi:MAG: TFIIB-type zinc ribbon-containing protein [Nitrososphaerota archaeon]|jgi:transcription initiation factor TFIIIB Brf1 subunit/transcription initiation factor TFIIB|nr:TFIIB-type zinc ribbon-containing protein [Nitrososphaerota archaeon]
MLTEKCPECHSTHLFIDNKNGEIVCKTCGLVLGSAEFAPPAERIPKTNPTNPIAYTSLCIGTEIAPTQRTELNVAHDINHIIQKLNLPHTIETIAITYMQKLRRITNKQKNSQIRLTRTELTTLSIWTAIKLTNYPLSADEYLKKLQPLYKIPNLMKTQRRASYFIKNKPQIPNTTLLTGHINKLVSKLENNLLDSNYANKINSYAIQIIIANPGILTNRKANLIAASALLAADELIANQLSLKTMAQVANIGTSRLSELTKTCKQYAPELPKECAALKFSCYLFKETTCVKT